MQGDLGKRHMLRNIGSRAGSKGFRAFILTLAGAIVVLLAALAMVSPG